MPRLPIGGCPDSGPHSWHYFVAGLADYATARRLVLDNTRILNGRSGFSGTGQRHLQACWADLDGLASTVALLRRRKQNGRTRH